MQANTYEGFTVWVNAMIESAGRRDPLRPRDGGAARRARPRRRWRVMGRLAQLRRPPPRTSPPRRGHRTARLRGRRLRLHGQLHLRLRERQARTPPTSPRRWASPATRRSSRASRAGRRWAASTSASAPTPSNPDQAFEAAACVSNRREPARPRPSSTACRPRAQDLYSRQGGPEGISRASRAWSRSRSTTPPRGRRPRPTRTSRWRSRTRSTRPARSIPTTRRPPMTSCASNLEDAVQREGLL